VRKVRSEEKGVVGGRGEGKKGEMEVSTTTKETVFPLSGASRAGNYGCAVSFVQWEVKLIEPTTSTIVRGKTAVEAAAGRTSFTLG